MVYQFINGFTASLALTAIVTLIANKNSDKSSTEKKEKAVTKKPKKKKEHPHYSEDVPTSLFDTPNDDEDEMIEHLKRLVELMDIIDDGLESTVQQDPEAEQIYEEFGNFYLTIVPYIEIVSVTYQQSLVSELKPSVNKLYKLVMKLIDNFIGDIYSDTSVGVGVQLKYEVEKVLMLAHIKIKEETGRPSFDSVMTDIDDETSDEN